MMSISKIHFLMLGLFFSCSSHADFLFECLKTRDYECLSDEFDLDQRWQKRQNDAHQTPLQYAIEAKDSELVTYLIRKGARVKKDHINLAMKHFFDVELSFKTGTIDLNDKTLTKTEQMLLAATQESSKKQQVRLSKIIGLFAKKEEIATSIQKISQESLLSEREANIYFREYKNLFFQNNSISLNELITIVEISQTMKVDKFVLLLICKALKTGSSKNTLTENLTVKNSVGDKDAEQKMAYAIIEKSRRTFMKFTPELLFNEVINFENSSLLKEALEAGKKLSSFIEKTICYSPQQINIDRNYKTWLSVYRIVAQNGDFMGAFSIAEALNQTSVEEIVSGKIYQKIEVLNEESNYENYRAQANLFRHKFHIPSLIVLHKDIAEAIELEQLMDSFPYQTLKTSTLMHIIKLKEKLSKTYGRILRRSYQSSPEFHELLENLTLYESNNKKWKEAYRMMWPIVKNRRTVSLRFDEKSSMLREATTILGVPKSVTPRE